MRDDDDLSGRIGDTAVYGRVKAVDLARGRLTVAVGDLETDDIRWVTGAAGGTRTWSRPKVGEQVLLISPDGDMAGAIALRGVVSDTFPPIGDEDREVIQFEDGATIAYDPSSHAMEFTLPGGGSLRIVAPDGAKIEADVTIVGKLKVEGAIEATGDIEAAGDVKAGTVSLRNHVHLGVQSGSGLSQKPKP